MGVGTADPKAINTDAFFPVGWPRENINGYYQACLLERN